MELEPYQIADMEKIEDLEEKIQQLEERLADCRSGQAVQAANIEDLKSNLVGCSNAKAIIRLELSKKDADLDVAHTRNETLESEIAALNKDIADKANAIHGLGEQIDLLKSIIIDGLREREDYD